MVYAEAANMTGLVGMFQYANDISKVGSNEGVFVILLLLSLYVVPLIYTLMRNEKPLNCMMAAGFLATMGAVFLRVAEILTYDRYLWFCVILLIIPLVLTYTSQDTST